jgi:tRNA (guanosine-2'-O-)-methyltransferase
MSLHGSSSALMDAAAATSAGSAADAASPRERGFCAVCKIECGNPRRYAQHISGRRHRQAVSSSSSSAAAGDTATQQEVDLQPEPELQGDLDQEDERTWEASDGDAALPPLAGSVAAAVVHSLAPLISATRLRSLQVAAAQRCGTVHLVFENVVQNENVASALRTAECAGIHHVHLIRGPQALSSKRGGSLKRVDNALSKGAERWLQLHYHSDTTSFVRAMQTAGISLFGADVDPSATPIADCEFSRRSGAPADHSADSADVAGDSGSGCAIIFGNERDGMSAELRSACDGLFFLPSVGLTQSYNVFVSAAMTVHHLQMRAVLKPDRNDAQQEVALIRGMTDPNCIHFV